MPYDINIREEELKIKVAKDYFGTYENSKIIGNIDFCISAIKNQDTIYETESLLWAEAKKGTSDIYNSLVQLILTIGKARTFDKYLPPTMLGAFDAKKIAFVQYNEIQDIFYLNDFNWNVTPSNYETKEFKMVYNKVKRILDQNALLYFFDKDDKELRKFIKENFTVGKFGFTKTRIDKNNFIVIYNKWLQSVKPTIAVNWEIAKKAGLIDGDFYLADLLSEDNITLKEKLFVLLKKDHYDLDRKLNEYGVFTSSSTTFTDNQKVHNQFWNKYERPPLEQYWDYIVERRDLLVPQDIRERKGSFFTPQIWVELSQKYLADVLGEDWQDEYYIWDCAAGTGNLLNGLTNKYNIWASTLDKQDVDVMKDRIKNGANLLEDHVFQFDFLNDSFDKLPKPLFEIINNPEKRKKLVIYINPPYAEAPKRQFYESGKVAVEQSKMNKKYASILGQANKELFAQFLTRIYLEISDCVVAHFSTLKFITGQHFIDFRKFFMAKFLKSFMCPSFSFDNVNSKFPIGFIIWDTSSKNYINEIITEVFDENRKKLFDKKFQTYNDAQYINQWIKPHRADVSKNQLIGKFPFMGNDFQQQNIIQISHHNMLYNKAAGQFYINQKNLMYACVYFAVRKCIKTNWIINGDQFLSPNDKWESDIEFQSDCLTFTLFSNNIRSAYGINHWIPFTENEVNSREKFESNFMTKYINGKIDTKITTNLFEKIDKSEEKPLQFSPQAKAVFDVGRELWKYYHAQPNCNVNASLYDIREYFQGRNEKGKMKNKSTDDNYINLIANLRDSLKTLAQKIEPQVYEYEFLKK